MCIRDRLNAILQELGETDLKEPLKALELMKRPKVTYDVIERILEENSPLDIDVKEQVEIQVKYEGYITKSHQQVDRMKKMENKVIPEDIDYSAISGLATEARQKLETVRPLSMGQASRISGVNPADISILLVYIEQGQIKRLSDEKR